MSVNILSPPYRAEQIGSLKRPTALLEKRFQFDKKEISQEELTVAEDEAVTKIIAMQREAGIKAMTDGEFRRYVLDRPSYTLSMRYLKMDHLLQAHVLRWCFR